jgi:hypothetical protein
MSDPNRLAGTQSRSSLRKAVADTQYRRRLDERSFNVTKQRLRLQQRLH